MLSGMEKDKYIDFLKELSITIGKEKDLREQYDLNDNFFQSELMKLKKKLTKKYDELLSLGIENTFLEFIESEYCDEIEMYLDLLNYINCMTGALKPVIKYLDKLLDIGLSNDGDLWGLLNIQAQIESYAFREGMDRVFETEWAINRQLTEKMKKELKADYHRIPLKDRDKDFIVIVISGFLSIQHAPTRVVCEISRIFSKYLKKKVLVLNVLLKTDVDFLHSIGMSCVHCANYRPELNGTHHLDYKGEIINLYQLLLEKNNLSELSDILSDICEQKPLCVWDFASMPVVAGIMKMFTTCIYTFMSQGYPPIEADIICNYIPTNNPIHLKNKAFLEKNLVKIKETEFLFSYLSPKEKLDRNTFGIPEDGFVLGIVGNRLTEECNYAFMEVIEQIVCTNSNIYVLFIGDVAEEFQKKVKENSLHYKNYIFIKSIGEPSKFMEHLDVLDLFVNPPRRGGGNSGAMSMTLGKPVITLKEGDVAAVAGEGFVVDSLQDYLPLVLKYKNDKIFYERQSKKAVKKIEEMTTDDEELADILRQVLEMIE